LALDANKSILKWVPSDHDPEADSVLGRRENYKRFI